MNPVVCLIERGKGNCRPACGVFFADEARKVQWEAVSEKFLWSDKDEERPECTKTESCVSTAQICMKPNGQGLARRI